MSRASYDRSRAIVPGTWQNRQGRADEWTAAPAASVGVALGILAVALVSLGAAIVQVFS